MNSLLPCLKTEIQNHKPANEYVKYDKLKVIRNLVTWKHKHRCFKLFLAFAHLFSSSFSLSEIEKEISHFQFALHFGSVLFFFGFSNKRAMREHFSLHVSAVSHHKCLKMEIYKTDDKHKKTYTRFFRWKRRYRTILKFRRTKD